MINYGFFRSRSWGETELFSFFLFDGECYATEGLEYEARIVHP